VAVDRRRSGRKLERVDRVAVALACDQQVVSGGGFALPGAGRAARLARGIQVIAVSGAGHMAIGLKARGDRLRGIAIPVAIDDRVVDSSVDRIGGLLLSCTTCAYRVILLFLSHFYPEPLFKLYG